MKDTKDENKYRQPRKEGYPQKGPAEQGRYEEAYESSRITENNITDTNLSTERLLEKILDKDNMNFAYKKVKSNKGAGGIDGMEVDTGSPFDVLPLSMIILQEFKVGFLKPQMAAC